MTHITKFYRHREREEFQVPTATLTDRHIERIVAAIVERLSAVSPPPPAVSPEEIAGAASRAVASLPDDIDRLVRRALEEHDAGRPQGTPGRSGLSENDKIELSRLIISRLSAEMATLSEQMVARLTAGAGASLNPDEVAEKILSKMPAASAPNADELRSLIQSAVREAIPAQVPMSDESVERLTSELAAHLSESVPPEIHLSAESIEKLAVALGSSGGARPDAGGETRLSDESHDRLVAAVADLVGDRIMLESATLSDQSIERLAELVAQRVSGGKGSGGSLEELRRELWAAVAELGQKPAGPASTDLADAVARRVLEGIAPEVRLSRESHDGLMAAVTKVSLEAVNELRNDLKQDLAALAERTKAAPQAAPGIRPEEIRAIALQVVNGMMASRTTTRMAPPIDPMKIVTDVSERLRLAQAKHAEAMRGAILKAFRGQVKKSLPALIVDSVRRAMKSHGNGKLDAGKLVADIRAAVRKAVPTPPTPREYREKLAALIKASVKRAATGRVKIKKPALERLTAALLRQVDAGLTELQTVTQPGFKGFKKLLPQIVQEAVRKATPRKPPEVDTARVAGALSRRLSRVLNTVPSVLQSSVKRAVPAIVVDAVRRGLAAHKNGNGKIDMAKLASEVRAAIRKSMPVPPTPREYRERLESLVRSSMRKASGRVKLRKPALERLTGSLWKHVEEQLPELQIVTQPAWRALKKLLPQIVQESVRRSLPKRPAKEPQLDTARVAGAISRRLSKILNNLPGAVRSSIRKGMPKEVRLTGPSLDRMVAAIARDLREVMARALGVPAPQLPSGVTKVRERVLTEVATMLPELVRNSVDRAFDTRMRTFTGVIGVPPQVSSKSKVQGPKADA